MKIYLSVILLLILFISSCQHKIYQVVSEITADGKYDSTPPTLEVSPYLEEISASVKLISCLSFYESYSFDRQSAIRRSDIRRSGFQKAAYQRMVFEQPVIGTGTVLQSFQDQLLLLTSAHVITSPDTIYSYFKNEDNRNTEFIDNVSIKLRHEINVVYIPKSRQIDILAIDENVDVALLEVELESPIAHSVPPIKYPLGSAAELNWGSFVYLMGYPHGKKVLTSALVSNPNRDKNHGFIIDATMHRGVSGGLTLALRDGPPHFEVVGMVNALSAETDYVLRPDDGYVHSSAGTAVPYPGDVYVDTDVRIISGIIYAVSAEQIRTFIQAHLPLIQSGGYDLKGFLN